MKISLGGYGQPYTEPIAEMKQKQNGSFTQVNYASPNSKNLDNFIRLDASLSYNFNFSSSIKASLRAGVINFTNETM
jgi:hypothetical protein